MIKTVWKLSLDPRCPDVPQLHYVSFGAAFLHVDRDPDDEQRVAVWFECDPMQSEVRHRFWLVRVGQEIPVGAVYIGSVTMALWEGEVISNFSIHVYHGGKADG